MRFKFVYNTTSHNYPLGSIIELSETDVLHLTRGSSIGNKYIAQIQSNHHFIEEGYDRNWRGNNFNIHDIVRYDAESVVSNLDSPDTKIIKKKVRTEEADKYKDNMVIVLKKDKETIYLSTALRHTLLHESNRIGFAFDKEKNSNFIYCEFEEKEGYEVSESGEIKSAAEWRDLFNSFNQSELYLKNKYTKDKDNPDYLFYEIQTEKDTIFKTPSRKTATKISNMWATEPPIYYSGSLGLDPLTGVKEDADVAVAVKQSTTKGTLSKSFDEFRKELKEAPFSKSVQELKDKMEDDLKDLSSYKLEYINLNNDKIEIGKEVPSEVKSENTSF